MKVPNRAPRPALTRLTLAITLLIGLCLGAATQRASAANKIWDGGGDQSSWSGSPANWDLDTDPAANDSLFFGGIVGTFPNNNFPNDTDFAGITFNAGADPFTLSGNEIDLAANSGITNLSVNVQTISANVDNNGANKVHNAFAGDLVYTGVLRANSLIKEGTNSLTTTGPTGNSAPGIIINDGTVIMAKAAGNAFAGNIVVHTNGTLRLVSAGTHTDQIHFNTRVTMNGGKWQLQHVDSVNTTRLEEIASLSGSNVNSIVENGLAASTNTVRIGGGNNHRAIYSGTLRDGAAGVLNLEVYRGGNLQQFNGTNTYSGVTLVNNVQASGTTRYILNGVHIGGGAYTVNGNASDRFAYLNGGGVISASVINVNGQGNIAPGGSLSADLSDSATFADSTAILTISNAVNFNASTATLEVQCNGNTAGSGYDQLVIAGSGTISNNLSNLKVSLGYTPAPGDKFTIVDVEGTDSAKTMGTYGSFNGVAASMAQGAIIVDPNTGQSFRISYRAEGSTFDMGAGLGNNIMLEAISPVGGQQLTWRGDASSDWDITTTANWRTAGNVASLFANTDFVTFDNSGSNSAPVNLIGDLTPATISINSTNNYELGGAGKLTGLVIITKTNTGKLTITTDNDNVGATLLRQGSIQIGTNGTSGLLSGNISMNTNTTLIFNRSDASTFAGVISGQGTVVNNSTNGTLMLTANSPFNGGVLANAGTLQFGDGSGITGSLAGRVTNNASVTYNFNNAVTINNSLSGTGRVNLVNSTGTSRKYLIAANVNNTAFSGYFDVGPAVCLNTPDLSNGTNQFGIGSTVYVQDTGSLYLDRGGYYLSTFYIQGAGNGAGSAGTPVTMEIEGISPPTTIAGDVNVLSSVSIGGFIGTSRIAGRLIDTNGTSTITFANGRGPGTGINLQLGSVSGPNHWGTTVIDPDLSGGAFTITAMTPNAISTNSLTLGAHGNFALNGNNHTIASLASTAAGGAILNSHATTAAVLSVGADDSSTTFDGAFGNGGAAALGLTKVGAGTLTLSAGSSNTGPVSVNGGVVALTGEGSFSNATVISVGTGATLDVSARADGTLTLNSGQTLKHSGNATGPITVTGNVNIGNGSLLLGVTHAGLAHDSLAAGGSVSYSGTLAVTNIGAALQVGDKFQLFTGAASGFAAFDLPTFDRVNQVQYTWKNDVASDGSVTVLSVAPITSPTLSLGQAGNNLTFSWTGPFKLQAQTNAINIGVSSNWFDYPGGGTSPVNVTINPTNPTVFFRLSLQ